MEIFRRKYFIYPEIQKPLLRLAALTFLTTIIISILAFYSSLYWLNSVTQLNPSLVVDYKILGAWKNILLAIFCLLAVINFSFSIYFVLFVSNRFAGPIFRLEREIDMFLSGEKKELSVSFRKNDCLHRLAEKINLIQKKL